MRLKINKHQIIGLALILGFFIPWLSAEKPVKNIIFMVPDGMGLADVTAARVYKFGLNKERLALEKLEHIGYQSTYSRDSVVTDSAAAASAWACGEKFVNGEISCHGDTGVCPTTILELAKIQGKSTGLVATSTITHATPAAFGAHLQARNCENEIARQYILQTQVDVLLGGGKGKFVSDKPDACGASGNYLTFAKEKGYTVIFTRDELLSQKNPAKLLGLFHEGPMSPVEKRESDETLKANEPTLAEMTKAALSVLKKNKKGFFLLVEGSQVDWGNHANNLGYQVTELIAFDQAVQEVLDWIAAEGERKRDTLLIVVADHETGGFAINGPYGSTITQPGQMVNDGWTSKNHTGVDTMILSQGPYSQYLGRAIDNTDVFHVMKAALKGLGVAIVF